MIVGIPKEIKADEHRIALAPAGVKMLTDGGHQVLVEKGAGLGSGFDDATFKQVGARIVQDADQIWKESEMVMKVKEPQQTEYRFFRPGLILFTYLHLASDRELTLALRQSGVIAIAYETIQAQDGSLPLLTPMSEVAGRLSVQIAAHFLQKPHGGRGILLAGVPGVSRGHVVVVGGGIVGMNAVKMALGLGAQVTILDISANRLRYLDELFGGQAEVLMSNAYNIEDALIRADIAIGAVLIPGGRAPKLIREEMVQKMRPGGIIIDVAIDQGGCVETIDHVTTHSEPTYEKYGVIHYAVANIPGAVPRTSTLALTNVTASYALRIANDGYRQVAASDSGFARGINVISGKITHPAVAQVVAEKYTPIKEVLSL